MNKVIMIGNISKAPQAHTTQGGISRSTFDIAVQRRYKNEAGTYDADFFTVVAWRQTADFCNCYLDKGRRVAVEGSVQVRSYTAQDGSKRWVTEIIADHVEALNKAKEAPKDAPQQGQFTEVEDDELPFD
ncbi:MAG: single-stranded DNA-binding protein [Oscillospiraceae bacterium]|nr:single-stranded DNA-binding protein [Oscillospiraceae bacterium]